MHKLTEQSQIKLYILYMMDRISRPVTYSEIQDAVWLGGFVGYFDFQSIFALLENEKNIQPDTSAEPATYTLTPRGTQIVENLSHLLDYEVRDKGLKAAMSYIRFQRTGADVAVEVKPDGAGHRIMLDIREKGIDKLSVSLYVQDQQLASNMVYNAKERPEVIYRGILALLAGDVNFLPLD